jgi:hypothetical protein
MTKQAWLQLTVMGQQEVLNPKIAEQELQAEHVVSVGS